MKIFTLLHLFFVISYVYCQDHCVMRGGCLEDDVTGFMKPCVYNGDPVPLTNNASINFLKKACPDLDMGDNYTVCCDDDQVDLFKDNLNTLATMFQRCPSCFHNLANLFCNLVCSQTQSRFMEVINSTETEDKQLAINEMNYYITESFAQGLFDSCSNVQLSFSPDKAITIACGNHGGDCNPQLWLDYMGGHDPSPYLIDFKFENSTITVNGTTYYPMNETIVKCYEPVSEGGAPCSWVDCPNNINPPAEFPTNHTKVLGLPLMIAVMMIAYLILAIIIIAGFTYASCKRKNEDEDLLISDNTNFKDSAVCGKWGADFDSWLKRMFTRWGTLCATYPLTVLLIGVIFIIIFSCGLFFFTVRTNPVELWSAEHSQAREEKDYFDQHFEPFYRTEQVIITRKSGDPVVGNKLTFSKVFDRNFLHKILDLQDQITSLTVERDNRTVRFQDICFDPVEKQKCMIQSVVNWFQNNATHLDYYKTTDDYLKFLKGCFKDPMFVPKVGLSCLGEYGGPVFPYVALGGVGDQNYPNATALILTFMVRNHIGDENNADAIAWERRFIEFMQNLNMPDIDVSYSSEQSIQSELDRESAADEATILISYLVMFAYVSITLGQYHSCGLMLIKSKVLLGLSGVIIVLASVVSSLGIFSYMGVPATLIIIEVIPFLVLAVGVDNIFIIVQTYQRSRRGPLETRQQHIGRVIGEVSPSIFLASFAESSCFFLGALSSMPAVHVFALYSGLALLIDFLLQISCFVALLSLDVAREESSRLDVCCCIKKSNAQLPEQKKGFLYNIFDKYYAPFLMKDFTRCIVLLVFSAWACLSISVMDVIDVGLDQKLSMPKDSYVLKYFTALEDYLSVGPPVYFVLKSGVNYTDVTEQNTLCSVVNCSYESLVTQVSKAAMYSNRTYIAHPPLDWLDNYISWAQSEDKCCRVYKSNDTVFCPSTEQANVCEPCGLLDKATQRPDPKQFQSFLLDFLNDNPTANCPVGGHAGFADALELRNDSVGASHYMTYHTILKDSNDYTQALRWARRVAENITYTLHLNDLENPNVEVFPYSIFYVFYEQYLTVSKDTVISITISIVNIFIVTFLLMGLDYHSALIMVVTIMMIVFDLMGLMFFWDISLNAVSLVNLVMAVGISVEFCSHIIRSFAFNPIGSKIDRARNAVAHMGSSVLSGITLTKFGGIIVLAFSKSQIFQVFYFRMYLGIVLIGAAHGLIFLPVFLSVVGPPIKLRYDRSRGNPLKVSMEEENFNPEVSSVSKQ